MKILILNYEYPPIGGGAAPVSRDISEELKKCGDEIVVVSMSWGDLPYYSVENGVTVYRLDCKRKRKDTCTPIEQYNYIRAVRRFMKEHQELQSYDVCHAHFVIPTGQAAYENKKKYGIPFIITVHGSDVEGHNKRFSVKVMHRLLRHGWRRIVDSAGCVVSPSLYIKQRMERNYPNGKYYYIPNGADHAFYRSLNKPEMKEKRILIMGRIQKFKNVQFIMDVIKIIRQEPYFYGWVVDIVGDGPYRAEIEKIIDDNGLSDVVCMHGWIDNKSSQLKRILSRAAIYISASSFENCPMSVIEATLAGCYPLVSDIPAHRQMLEGKYRFSLDTYTELAKKLKQAIQMQNRSEFLPEMSGYDGKKVTKEYRNLLGKYKR